MTPSNLLELLEKGPTYELHADDCNRLGEGSDSEDERYGCGDCDCFGPGLLKRIKEVLRDAS